MNFFSNVRVWLVVCAVMTFPALARAQTGLQGRTWDLTVLGGYLAGHPDLGDSSIYGDAWFHTGEVAVALGWHWTTHFKTEVDFTTSGEARQYVFRYTTTLPQRVPQSVERFTTVRAASASAIWQFFENEWVHPFVQAGVAVDFDRVRTYAWPQSNYIGDPRTGGAMVTLPEEREGPQTTSAARALVGGGVRLYVSPRVFVRTDGRAVLGRGADRVSFRAGIGVDF